MPKLCSPVGPCIVETLSDRCVAKAYVASSIMEEADVS